MAHLQSPSPTNKVSFGHGIPYGGNLGGSIELKLKNNVYAIVGFGFLKDVTGGLRLYFRDAKKKVIPHLTYSTLLTYVENRLSTGLLCIGCDVNSFYHEGLILSIGIGYGGISEDKKVRFLLGIGFTPI